MSWCYCSPVWWYHLTCRNKLKIKIIGSRCVKSVRIWSYSGPYLPAFGLNTDQNNSEFRQFLCSVSSDFEVLKFIILSFCRFIFSHLQVLYILFNKFFLIHFMNKNSWILSLAVTYFVFNFESRKSKQT